MKSKRAILSFDQNRQILNRERDGGRILWTVYVNVSHAYKNGKRVMGNVKLSMSSEKASACVDTSRPIETSIKLYCE
jgi:hypothetical protein